MDETKWAIQPLLVTGPQHKTHLTLIIYDKCFSSRPTQWFFDPGMDDDPSLTEWMCTSPNACLLEGYSCKAILIPEDQSPVALLGGGPWASATACILFATILWHLTPSSLGPFDLLEKLIAWLRSGTKGHREERRQRLIIWTVMQLSKTIKTPELHTRNGLEAC